jgi:hypothetical protein
MSREGPEISSALLKTLEQLWAEGSPVAGGTAEQRARLVSFALRRIRSFGHGLVVPRERSQQVRDLAKSLAAQFERKPQLVGTLIKDYEHLAEAILTIYSHEPNGHDA